ncbi:daunorubicin resistance protein DrrA family ABC transporter ATP-binding protein [Thioalkalivibrio sp. ALE11]|uniref:daunorubicin resistance protein DrrA family ABC transporter ATP-binding protein n=1 Tax=Thioalkalivibrio sp. ALE11 TaxID=1265494 RepID=UPI000369A60C|nr:daunorubicin resistance protein DrrA family ABC transporter ATP-binding protein [Thioalkalivibrio sp. ALE11]
MDNTIEVEGLVRDFAGARAVDEVSLQVPAGHVLGLLGPNGAGKTTTVRMLATLLSPTAGRARVGGLDVVDEAARVREIIGLTGQYASVDEKLTGRENLILIARLLGMKRAAARARADELLFDFSLQEAGHRPVQTYSGGMRRRLDLAASLVGRPRILFLDEPSTGLDPRARRDLWARVRRLQDAGTTVLLTTQYLEEADALADSIVVLDQGRVIAEGTAAELKARVGTRTLFLRLARADQADAAARQVATLTGSEPHVEGETLSAPVAEASLLPAVLRELDAAGIEVAELGLRSASLDDVFLSLTGQTGSAGAPADAAGDSGEDAA